MAVCPSCNAILADDSKFCANCGVAILIKDNTTQSVKKDLRDNEDRCFGDGEGDRLDLVSFGFFIIAVGIIFSLNSHIFSDFGSWIELVVETQMVKRPPERLIISIMLFFSLIGVSSFLTSIIRFFIERIRRRVLSDALSGVAFLLFAYLINQYNLYLLTWQAVLGIELAACGVLVIIYTAIRYAFLE